MDNKKWICWVALGEKGMDMIGASASCSLVTGEIDLHYKLCLDVTS
jgi:hypothetical protein